MIKINITWISIFLLLSSCKTDSITKSEIVYLLENCDSLKKGSARMYLGHLNFDDLPSSEENYFSLAEKGLVILKPLKNPRHFEVLLSEKAKEYVIPFRKQSESNPLDDFYNPEEYKRFDIHLSTYEYTVNDIIEIQNMQESGLIRVTIGLERVDTPFKFLSKKETPTKKTKTLILKKVGEDWKYCD